MVLVGLLPLLAFAWWLRGQVLGDATTFIAYCNATHPGEAWSHAQERAAAHEWTFVRQSPQGREPEEWLAQLDFWSYRAGCVVTVAKGRVVRTHFAELPKL